MILFNHEVYLWMIIHLSFLSLFFFLFRKIYMHTTNDLKIEPNRLIQPVLCLVWFAPKTILTLNKREPTVQPTKRWTGYDFKEPTSFMCNYFEPLDHDPTILFILSRQTQFLQKKLQPSCGLPLHACSLTLRLWPWRLPRWH